MLIMFIFKMIVNLYLTLLTFVIMGSIWNEGHWYHGILLGSVLVAAISLFKILIDEYRTKKGV